MINPNSSKAPRIEPITIPAIAPPLSPLPPPEDPAAAVVPVGEDAGRVEEKTTAIEEKTGSVTSWHLLWVLEVKQQESVAFWVLARQ